MTDTTQTKQELKRFLLPTFGLAWVLQGLAIRFALLGNAGAFSGILAVSMFCPLLGAWFAGGGLRFGWKPAFKGKLRWWLLGWFAPAGLTLLGAVLFFLLFPGLLDVSGQSLLAAYGPALQAQLEAQGLTPLLFVAVTAVQAVTYAPAINMLFGVGEEAGWRGYLYPRLAALYGKRKGRILGGLIWGAWHWPVIALAGYEYGFGYWGAPISGMVLFCVVCVVLGTLLDVLYEKSGCIWLPALAHGAVNAIAAAPLLVLLPTEANYRLLGPAPMGLVALLPMLVLAAVALAKSDC